MTGEADTIGGIIRHFAARTPDATAILAPGRAPLCYRDLALQADYVQQTLNGWGIGRGDRVAIVVPDRPEMAVAFLTVSSCATGAPLNPDYTASEFELYLQELKVKALIVPAGLKTPARAAARRLGVTVIDLVAQPGSPAGVFKLSGGQPAAAARAGPAQAADLVLVLHTSGTTSKPKIVPICHARMTGRAYTNAGWFALEPDDRCLNIMPLSYHHGLNGALVSPLAAGSSIVCPPRFDADEFFGLLEEFNPTWYSAGPTHHQAIVARAVEHKEVITRCRLRFIRSAVGRLSEQVMSALEEAFGVSVIQGYGMTEAGFVTANPLPPGKRKPGTVGVPVNGEVAVVDAHGNILPPGETGEVVVRDSGVIDGYENNPQANAQSFDDGWFKTGDQGYFDDDGYLTLSGRIKDVINRGGEKISPHEVEDVLASAAEVAEAVCFPVAHRTLGEEIAAAVVLREGEVVSEDDLRTFAFERLAPSKVPRRIFIVDALPKGPTGKLQRTLLAQQLTRAGSALGALGGVGKSP